MLRGRSKGTPQKNQPQSLEGGEQSASEEESCQKEDHHEENRQGKDH